MLSYDLVYVVAGIEALYSDEIDRDSRIYISKNLGRFANKMGFTYTENFNDENVYIPTNRFSNIELPNKKIFKSFFPDHFQLESGLIVSGRVVKAIGLEKKWSDAEKLDLELMKESGIDVKGLERKAYN